MNDNYNTPNSGCCGRPMGYAAQSKHDQNHCCFNEYNYKMKACIRKGNPSCDAQAVIPAITLETTFGLTSYTNCFVHVTSNNTTYYVDDKGTPIITWAGPVDYVSDIEFSDLSDIPAWNEMVSWLKANPLNLRGQDCYFYVKFQSNETMELLLPFLVHYDVSGKPFILNFPLDPAKSRVEPI